MDVGSGIYGIYVVEDIAGMTMYLKKFNPVRILSFFTIKNYRDFFLDITYGNTVSRCPSWDIIINCHTL